jgi:polyphosphate kinase
MVEMLPGCVQMLEEKVFEAMHEDLAGRRLYCGELVRQTVGPSVETDIVELLLTVFEDNTTRSYSVDGVLGHIQALSKAERPSFDLDNFAVRVGDRSDLITCEITDVHAECDLV